MTPVETATPVRASTAALTIAPHSAATEEQKPSPMVNGRAWIACGILLLVFGIYALSSPGRIDIVDGEARYDVAFNWVINGRPIMSDSWIIPFMAVRGRGGFHYSYFGAPASFFALPLVWAGMYSNNPQFLFSMVSPFFGAAVAPILFLLYLELGLNRRRALAWTLVSSFASYLWAISDSSFDNAQHAFFTVAAVYFGVLSARRKSPLLAALGGAMVGVLFAYQEYFLLLVPALALVTLAGSARSGDRGDETRWLTLRCARYLRAAWNGPGEERSACIRYFVFAAAVGLGVMLSLAYNHLRFGSWLDDGKVRFAAHRGYNFFGDPLAGLLTLLVSPGKSVLLYSPTLVLAVLGARGLARRNAQLAAAIAVATVFLVLFLSCISFVGGDWCWGPRYLTPLLPLWALAFPFVAEGKYKRPLVVGAVALSFLVQALALSVETQRFFFEHRLHDFFWAEDSWFYFKHSALWSRLGEVATLPQGPPASATKFNSIPDPDWTTYTVLGQPRPIPRSMAPVWMRQFQIFYLPRPWPLWVPRLREEIQPVSPIAWLGGLGGILLLGTCFLYRGFQSPEFP